MTKEEIEFWAKKPETNKTPEKIGLTDFKVWFNGCTEPIIMRVPFFMIDSAHEFIWEQIGKRPSSMQRVDNL